MLSTCVCVVNATLYTVTVLSWIHISLCSLCCINNSSLNYIVRSRRESDITKRIISIAIYLTDKSLLRRQMRQGLSPFHYGLLGAIMSFLIMLLFVNTLITRGFTHSRMHARTHSLSRNLINRCSRHIRILYTANNVVGRSMHNFPKTVFFFRKNQIVLWKINF